MWPKTYMDKNQHLIASFDSIRAFKHGQIYTGQKYIWPIIHWPKIHMDNYPNAQKILGGGGR
jgi:hypothetical protein